MSGDESGTPGSRQDVAPAGDAYVAARDAFVASGDIHYHQAAPLTPAAPAARIWGGVPARNAAFTGREGLLRQIHDALGSGDRVAVRALRGMGGVGKTQIAIEYVHRHAAEYQIVWWLNAENATLLGEQFAALGAALNCAQAGMPLPLMRQTVHNELRQHGSWLLVFDNAVDPEDITDWLPGGSGHVLITSRTRTWRQVAVPLDVSVLSRAESVTLLGEWVGGLQETEARLVAEAVGDLPLALAQAAGFMADSGMPVAEYLSLLNERTPEVLDEGRPTSYPLSLAAVTKIAYDLLRDQDPAAADLAAICAFLAPEPIPADWFTAAASELSAPLRESAADRLAWRQLLARLTQSALARVDPDGLVMHRLTQAILRGHLSRAEDATFRGLAETVVAASGPGDPSLPSRWPAWARVLPHLLVLDPAGSDNSQLRKIAGDAVWYLSRRGDALAAHDLAGRLYELWRDLFGPDDGYTLRAANCLSEALRGMGRYAEARDLDEDVLSRRRRLYGDDDPNTFWDANNLAIDLRMVGEYGAARELDEGTLARRRRVLGEDHPDTLASSGNLVADLYELGESEAARELGEDTLARYRQVLGEDHPATLTSAGNLAIALYALGEYEAARELGEDTLARRRRVLGEDHPDTLTSASNLALDLDRLGESEAARELNAGTLARRRRVLGDDHPDTLNSANNLATDLYELGEYEAARELHADTLARRRRVLGEDHPDTLSSANSLGVDLHRLGEYEAARELHADTLARRRRVLGGDDPATQRTVRNLHADLQALGEAQPGDMDDEEF